MQRGTGICTRSTIADYVEGLTCVVLVGRVLVRVGFPAPRVRANSCRDSTHIGLSCLLWP